MAAKFRRVPDAAYMVNAIIQRITGCMQSMCKSKVNPKDSLCGFLCTLLTAAVYFSPATARADDSAAPSSINAPWGLNGNLPPAISYSLDQSLDTRLEGQNDTETELSFKLSPGKFEFSRAGAYGLTGVFANPELAVQSRSTNQLGPGNTVLEIHHGLSYSAGVKIEQEDADISGTAYVSSSQLGISYGRLGRVWYSGVDLSLGQYSDSHPEVSSSEVLSFDLTTGRRMGWTGVDSTDPLWLLSLEGNFDMQGEKGDSATGEDGDWYLNPSLFWRNPGFTFSAELQLPVDSQFLRDFEEPDYKLRAVFEKHFR